MTVAIVVYKGLIPVVGRILTNKELIIVPSCSHSENNVYHGKSYLQSGVQSEKAVECRRKGFDSGRGLPE